MACLRIGLRCPGIGGRGRRSLGAERATVVGHDWGGLVAWHVAMHHPDVVSSLVIMNAPHPRAFRRELKGNWAQKRRSWYIGFFQLPWLPEAMLALGATRWETIVGAVLHLH